MKIIQHIAFFIAFLYLTIYLPVFYATYFSGWYELNCRWHHRCVRLDSSQSKIHISELVRFLRHTGQLSHPDWSDKEKRHLTDVRMLLDFFFAAAAASLSLFFLTFDRSRLRRFALINIAVIMSSSAILPFFKYFWRDVFHRLVFKNNDWINYPSDVLYHITPRVFFLNTFILVIIISCVINCGILIIHLSTNFIHRRRDYPGAPHKVF